MLELWPSTHNAGGWSVACKTEQKEAFQLHKQQTKAGSVHQQAGVPLTRSAGCGNLFWGFHGHSHPGFCCLISVWPLWGLHPEFIKDLVKVKIQVVLSWPRLRSLVKCYICYNPRWLSFIWVRLWEDNILFFNSVFQKLGVGTHYGYNLLHFNCSLENRKRHLCGFSHKGHFMCLHRHAPESGLPDSLNSQGGKSLSRPQLVTGDISFKSLECWSPLSLQTCQDKPFWDTVKWFGLQVLHSVLLRLFSAGKQPPDDFHVVGVQANLLVPRNKTLLCTVSII